MPQEIQFIPIDKLKFDAKNPRLPITAHNQDEVAVLEWMLNKANLIELMASIAGTGFFPGEPLLVINDGDDSYTVVEGNRRLAAVKLLVRPDQAPVRKMSVQKVVNEGVLQ